MQRVPETEAKGRVHTSAATVAVMAEPEDVEIDLKPDDYRRDVFHASGPGGQHVNKTASAVRLTHYASGIVVSCQDEKSQHKNMAKALRVLKTRLYEAQARGGASQALRRAQDARSAPATAAQRIRTYNFPQNRLTDHRVNQNWNLENIIAGNLDPVIDALMECRAAGAAGRLRDHGMSGTACTDPTMHRSFNRRVTTRNPHAHAPNPGPSAGCCNGRPIISKRMALTARGWTPKCCWPTPWAAGGSSFTRPSTRRPARPKRTAFRELVRRRAEGTPVAYLVGAASSIRSVFASRPDVLIPRPETELLVIALLDLAKQQGRRARRLPMADVGTGSGIIAVCAAKHLPACRVTAIDSSPRGLGHRRGQRRRRTAWPSGSSWSKATCSRRSRPSGNSISSSAIRLTSARRNGAACRRK